MSAKEFATQLKTTIEEIKAKGTAAIYCDNLIAYLDEVIKSPSPVVSAAELEKFKADLQVWIEQNKAAHESNLEMFRSVIQSGSRRTFASGLHPRAWPLNGGVETVEKLFFPVKSSHRRLFVDLTPLNREGGVDGPLPALRR